MDPTIKTQWTTALRSGEFEQGRGCLRRGDKLCCFGVLCELAVRAGVIAPAKQAIPDSRLAYDGSVAFPTPVVLSWAGLPSLGLNHPDLNRFVVMNDRGVSFTAIADMIDEHLYL